MILTIIDTATHEAHIYERRPKGSGCLNGVRRITLDELEKRINGPDEDELAHMAMCGMFPGPIAPEDYTWR